MVPDESVISAPSLYLLNFFIVVKFFNVIGVFKILKEYRLAFPAQIDCLGAGKSLIFYNEQICV